MAAYALLSFTFLNSLSVYFIRCFSSDSDICHIQAVFSRFLLYPALCLLSLGFHWGRLGECFLGSLLELGSERSVGVDYVIALYVAGTYWLVTGIQSG